MQPSSGWRSIKGSIHCLAVASEHGATVHTFDRRLAEAGPPPGVPTQLLI
jgi:hypothetical protein